MHNEFPISHKVLEDSEFRKQRISTKYLYCVLCKHKNRYGRCEEWFYRSEEKLSQDAGIHIQTVKKCLKDLLRGKYIERNIRYIQSFRKCSWYRVIPYDELLHLRSQQISQG